MVKKIQVKQVLSLDDRKKLVAFFDILMVVDKQMKAKKRAKKVSKPKEDTIGSRLPVRYKITRGKARALSLSNNFFILNAITSISLRHVSYRRFFA